MAFVLFTVKGIKIPLPAQRLFGGIHQQLVLFAHVAVEVLHQVLLFSFEEKLQVFSAGQEMLGVHGLCFNTALGTEVFELLVEAVLVGQLVFEAFYGKFFNEPSQIFCKALAIFGRV